MRFDPSRDEPSPERHVPELPDAHGIASADESRAIDERNLSNCFGLETSSNLGELERPSEIEWVRSEEALQTLARRLEDRGLFGLDTETGGIAKFREPLNARLSLIQVYIPPEDPRESASNGAVAIIDALELEANAPRGRSPLEAFEAVLERRDVTKIVHHAAFEREQFRRYGIKLAGEVDTETLARRLRPELPSHSLQACMAEICGTRIDKSEQTSEWLRRPLSASQEAYAAADPVATFELYRTLSGLESRSALRGTRTPTEILHGMRQDYGEAKELVRPIANRYFALERRKERGRDGVKALLAEALEESEDPEEGVGFLGPAGSASARFPQRTKLDGALLTRLHPECAREIGDHFITMKALEALLVQELRLPKGRATQIVADVSAQYRTSCKFSIDPEYDRLYGGEPNDDPSHYLSADVLPSPAQVAEIRSLASLLREDLQTQSLAAYAKEIVGAELTPLLPEAPSPTVKARNEAVLELLHRTLVDLYAESEAPIPPSELSREERAQALLEDILLCTAEQLQLLREREVGNRYRIHTLRIEEGAAELERQLRGELGDTNGEVTVETLEGRASLRRSSSRRVNVDTLRERYPEAYALAAERGLIELTATKGDALRFFEGKGLSSAERALMVDALFPVVGRASRPELRMHPRWGLLY